MSDSKNAPVNRPDYIEKGHRGTPAAAPAMPMTQVPVSAVPPSPAAPKKQ